MADAGVVDEDVERGVRGVDCLGEPRDRRFVRDVELDELGAAAASRPIAASSVTSSCTNSAAPLSPRMASATRVPFAASRSAT